MADDSVVVRPSLPRLWLVCAAAMLPFAAIVAAMSPRYDNPFDFWLLVGATSLILIGAVVWFGLFARFLLLSFRVSEQGLEPRPSFLRAVVRWEDIDKVRVGMPFVFYVAGSAFRGWPLPRFVLLPTLWLVKEPEEFRRALERYAPEGHVLRRVFLGKEKPILSQVLALVFGLLVLLGFIAFLHYREPDPLHDAVSAGRAGEVVEIVRARPELVNARDRFGRTPLHWAAQKGHAKIAEHLILHGAELDVRDRTLGATPLHVAAGCGRHDVAMVLLKNGANPNIKDNQGRTALDMAVLNGHGAIADTLRRHGAR